MAALSKFIVVVCVSTSFWLSAGDKPPSFPIKTGFNSLRPTQKELSQMAQRLSRDRKDALSYQQLQAILPQAFIEALPITLFQELQFSLQDDHHMRGIKYIRLGLNLLNRSLLLEDQQKYDLAYQAYLHALHHLRQIRFIVPKGKKADYYLSLAQIESWVVRCYKQSGRQDDHYLKALLYEGLDSLKLAELHLHSEIPNETDFMEALQKARQLVDEAIDGLTEAQIQEVVTDPLERLALSQLGVEDEGFKGYRALIEAKMRRAQRQLGSNAHLSESIKRETLERYERLLTQKYLGHARSLEDKRHWLKEKDLTQSYKALWQSSVLTRVQREHWVQLDVMQHLHFFESYGHLLKIYEVEKVSQLPPLVKVVMQKKLLETLESFKELFLK